MTTATAQDTRIRFDITQAFPTAVGWVVTVEEPGSGYTAVFTGDGTGTPARQGDGFPAIVFDTNAAPSSTHTYRVIYTDRSVNDPDYEQVGSQTFTVTANAGPVAPGTPTLTSSLTRPNTINLSWSDVGADLYQLFRDGGYLTDVGGTSYSDTRPTGTTSSYQVRGVDIGQNGQPAFGGLSSSTTQTVNRAPLAPQRVSPADGTVLDRGIVQRLRWQHSDPDGDTQATRQVRYRIVGSPTWTTIAGASADPFYDLPANMPAGDYEWQVLTGDGFTAGPYSPSGFFSLRVLPIAPVIVDPVDGQTITEPSYAVAYTIPSNVDGDQMQVRTVADAGGMANAAVVYFDSGLVDSGPLQVDPITVSFAVNGRTEHVQARVRRAGLLSAWADVTIDVAYQPPAAPTVLLYELPEQGRIDVAVTAGTPTGMQPATVSADVEVEALDGRDPYRPVGTTVRVARLLEPPTTWTDWTPASDVTYRYRAVAVSANGATSPGPWLIAAVAPSLPGQDFEPADFDFDDFVTSGDTGPTTDYEAASFDAASYA